MKIVLAFDSFKNCLTSPEVCEIVKSAIMHAAPDWDVAALPLGDGGEGTARAIVAASGGVLKKCTVHDPLFRKIDSEWGMLPDNSAVFEMAQASGIELLSADERDPMLATSYGTGELLKHILCDCKISAVTVGIGGSATVDGGVGMLQALGVRFLNCSGKELAVPASAADIASIADIDMSEIIPEIKTARIRVACDVTNPLCGENGAAKVFAPQKGADAVMVEALENNLLNFGKVAVSCKIAENFTSAGDGAAGGVGFALRNFLKAELTSGAELVLDTVKFEQHLADADIVITGEGCSDGQTVCGKLPAVVAGYARKFGVPAVLVSGALGQGAEKLQEVFTAVFALTSAVCTLEEAIKNTPSNLKRTARAITNLLKISSR